MHHNDVFFIVFLFAFLRSGMRAVPDKEVIDAHHGTKLSVDVVGFLGTTSNMHQFVDIFSIPEITLFRDVIQVEKRKKKQLKIFLFSSRFCSKVFRR